MPRKQPARDNKKPVRTRNKVLSPTVIPTAKDEIKGKKGRNKKITKVPMYIDPLTNKPVEWLESPNKKYIGSGSFGTVYLYDKTPYGNVAVKVMTNTKVIDLNYTIIREISLINVIKHPNVINIVQIGVSSLDIAIILPLATCTLLDAINNKKVPAFEKVKEKTLTPAIIDSIIYQLVRGMIGIQDANILNKDYKSSNILLTNEKEFVKVTITDFGGAGLRDCYNISEKEIVSTRSYAAPELVLGITYTQRKKYAVQRLEFAKIKYKHITSSSFESRIVVPIEMERLQEIIANKFQQIKIKDIYSERSDSWALGVIIYEILTGELLGTSSYDILSILLGPINEETFPNLKLYPGYEDPDFILSQWFYDNVVETARGGGSTIYPTLEEKLERDIKGVYGKYIPMLLSLLKLNPVDRANISDLVYDDVFDDVRDEVDDYMNYEDKKYISSPLDDCEEHLELEMFPITKSTIIEDRYKTYHTNLMSDPNIRNMFGNRDLSHGIAILEEYLAIPGTKIPDVRIPVLLASSLVLAAKFDSSNRPFNTKEVRDTALHIWAKLGYNLSKSTAYDFLQIYVKGNLKLSKYISNT